MTDKQIMIHGVDVNRCMFFNKEYKEDDIQIKNFCEWQFVPCQEFDCAKCYFKNWKRKEQECERLKQWLPIVARLEEQFKSHEKAKGIDYKTYAEQVFTKLDQLKAELEQEKALKDTYFACYHATHDDLAKKYDQLKADNDELKKLLKDGGLHNLSLMAEKRVLLQTLAEIKPILEFYANSKIGEEQADGTYKIELAGNSMRGYGTDFLIFNPKPAKQALQKIREILDEI